MNSVHQYFIAERNASLTFIVIGIVAIVCSFYFWLGINSRFYNGIGWPLLFFALIQLGAGSFIYFRTPHDEKRVTGFLKNNMKNIKTLEMSRMEKVMKNFPIYRYAEMALMVVGLILFFATSEGGFWKGVALGIIIQAAILLIFDSFAEFRGKAYLNHLKAL